MRRRFSARTPSPTHPRLCRSPATGIHETCDFTLDPTKYRLHDRFAPPIVRLTFFAGQPLGHAHRSGIQLGINRRLIFPLPPQRHQHFHSLILLRCQFRKTIFGAKPRIAQHSFGRRPRFSLTASTIGTNCSLSAALLPSPMATISLLSASTTAWAL